MRNLFGIIVSLVFMGIVFLSSKLFENSSKEASRKYIHIMLSNWWIIAMVFFDNVIVASILPALFVVINWASYKFNIIKAMERDEEEKDGLGTVYYAVTLLILSILTFGKFIEYKGIYGPLIGLAGVAVMGYGDGFAAICGKTIKSPSYKIGTSTKTLAGSLTMLCITFIIVSGFLAYTGISGWFLKSIIISGIVTVLEAISIKGTDNLSVPLATVALLFVMI